MPETLKNQYNIDAKKQKCNKKIDLKKIENVRGAFNKFPDFFVQAFRIVVDS